MEKAMDYTGRSMVAGMLLGAGLVSGVLDPEMWKAYFFLFCGLLLTVRQFYLVCKDGGEG